MKYVYTLADTDDAQKGNNAYTPYRFRSFMHHLPT